MVFVKVQSGLRQIGLRRNSLRRMGLHRNSFRPTYHRRNGPRRKYLRPNSLGTIGFTQKKTMLYMAMATPGFTEFYLAFGTA